ncbi:MAG TPA: hypothetical protein VK477_13385, partial [Acidobacteriota bacterium]|nr:hypothetical protein [Acidobacteriota bacterium]
MAINDSTNLIIPSGILKALATLPVATPEKPDGYTIDFGKFENGTMKIGGEMKEAWLPLAAGGLGLSAKNRVKGALSFEFDLKHFNAAMLAYVFGSAAGSAPQPGKVVELFCYLAMISPGEGIDGTT